MGILEVPYVAKRNIQAGRFFGPIMARVLP
jgi:hypothetical protein